MTAVYYLAPQDWSGMSRTVRLCMASEEERDRKGLRGVNTFYYGDRSGGRGSAIDPEGLVTEFKLCCEWRRREVSLYRYVHPKPTVKAVRSHYVGRIVSIAQDSPRAFVLSFENGTDPITFCDASMEAE